LDTNAEDGWQQALILVKTPLTGNLLESEVDSMIEVANGRASAILGAGKTTAGGAGEMAQGSAQIVGFIQHTFRLQQDGAGGPGTIREDEAGEGGRWIVGGRGHGV